MKNEYRIIAKALEDIEHIIRLQGILYHLTKFKTEKSIP